MARSESEAAEEFLVWVREARDLVGSHFPNEIASAHNSMVIDTAKALMMTSKLSAIETAVTRLSTALDTGKDT